MKWKRFICRESGEPFYKDGSDNIWRLTTEEEKEKIGELKLEKTHVFIEVDEEEYKEI